MNTNKKVRRSRGERAESAIQVLILLAIGTCAAAASFTHVHNVAASHGQPGWLAWADAVVLELMSIATGLEIRRRHRSGQHAGFVMWVLIGAVAMSLSAQVVEAEASLIGWLAAALPAFGFLACVKIVLTRAPAVPPAEDQDAAVLEPAPSVLTDVPATVAADDDTTAPVDLLTLARQTAAAHRENYGRDITRDQLRHKLRVSTDLATELLRQLRPAQLVPVTAGAFERVNGPVLSAVTSDRHPSPHAGP